MDSRNKNISKRRRSTRVQRSIEEKARKNVKSELTLMNWKVFDMRMDEVLKEALKIYFEQDDYTDNADRIAYLSILKKICKVNDWHNKRIIENDVQIKCFTGKMLAECNKKKFQEYLSNWIKNKMEMVCEKTNELKFKAITKSYINRINSFGVKPNTIEEKITKFRRSTKESERNTSEASKEKNNKNCGNCRLCGSCTRLVIDLNDTCGYVLFKDLVQNYCRVELSEDPRLSQKVCVDCKISIENFIKFCDIIDKNQTALNEEFPALSLSIAIKEEIDIAPPSPPLSTDIDESQDTHTLLSNQDSPDFRIESVEGSLVADFDFTRFVDEMIFDDFDSINQFKYAALPNEPFNSTVESVDSQPPDVREKIEDLMLKIKKCSVPLYELPIEFIPSDSESEDDESSQESNNLLEEMETTSIIKNNSYKRQRTDEISNTSQSPLVNFYNTNF